jgi:DNA-binding GntR family transcriptional regulator
LRSARGTLKPGQRLTQDGVAKQQLNVSRLAINNALPVLKTQGFVREASRGLSVAPLDPKLFEAIYVY